jgi:hypothetical protein
VVATSFTMGISTMERTSPSELPSFLKLPLEIRQQIYNYVLPYTRSLPPPAHAASSVIWRRGNINLMLTNRQICDECRNILYGSNTFVIDISFDGIKFRYRWLLPSGLAPNRAYGFFEQFPPNNISRMRHLIVNVIHVDSYTGMIKYNCGGRGLTDGLRLRVESFVEALSTAQSLRSVRVRLSVGTSLLEEIRRVKVQLLECDKNPGLTQTVLNPLARLSGLQHVKILGAVTEHFAAVLEKKMRRTPA